VDQVRAVTKATEDIKAEISTGPWHKQRRWEMKREVIFAAAKRLSEIDDAVLNYPSWTLTLVSTKGIFTTCLPIV
jgi:hypothetical protein